MEIVRKELPNNWQNEIPHDVLELWKRLTLDPPARKRRVKEVVAERDPSEVSEKSSFPSQTDSNGEGMRGTWRAPRRQAALIRDE